MLLPPLCMCIIPSGSVKTGPASDAVIDFDEAYTDALEGELEASGVEPWRVDAGLFAGEARQALTEHLLLCDFALVVNVAGDDPPLSSYELGQRELIHPRSTEIISVELGSPPAGTLMHPLFGHPGSPTEVTCQAELEQAMTSFAKYLRAGTRPQRHALVDSTLMLLYGEVRLGGPRRLKADNFHELIHHEHLLREQLRRMQKRKKASQDEQKNMARLLQPAAPQTPAGLLEYLMTCRTLNAWQTIIDLHDGELPPTLRRSVMVQELLGMACNRMERGSERAEQILSALIEEHGPDSETCGILGRVFKDRFDKADSSEKDTLLTMAIRIYRLGFEADMRDYYPGINAITLMEVSPLEKHKKQKAELMPIVRYAVERALAQDRTDYWAWATALELAVLDRDEEGARECMVDLKATEWESWSPGSTAENLTKIKRAFREGKSLAWVGKIIEELEHVAQRYAGRWWAFKRNADASTLELRFSRVDTPDESHKFLCRYILDVPYMFGTGDVLLPWDTAALQLMQRTVEYVEDTVATQPEVIHGYGMQLRQALDAVPGLDEAFQELLDAKNRRLVISAKSKLIPQLPWEAVPTAGQSGHGPFALKPRNSLRRRFSRKSRSPNPGTPDEGGSLMFAWSESHQLVPWEAHDVILDRICKARGIKLIRVPKASLPQIREKAQRAKNAGRPVRALHLLCHGQLVTTDSKAWGLALDGPEGEVVNPKTFQTLLETELEHLVLMTLSFCDSANPGEVATKEDRTPPIGSVAQAGFASGVDVVGSQYMLTIPGSTLAMEKLYGILLGEGLPLENAMQMARALLDTDGPSQTHDWASLVLMEHE